MCPWAPPLGMGIIDVRDAAMAHALAMATYLDPHLVLAIPSAATSSTSTTATTGAPAEPPAGAAHEDHAPARADDAEGGAAAAVASQLVQAQERGMQDGGHGRMANGAGAGDGGDDGSGGGGPPMARRYLISAKSCYLLLFAANVGAVHQYISTLHY